MGNLFRLNLVSSGGKTIPVAHPFARARRSSGFSRFLLSWSASSDSTTGADGREKLAQENIPALTLGALDDDYSRDVWVLMATRVQRWRFLADGSEQLVSDEFVDEAISRAVKVAFVTAPRDDGALDLELLDLVVTG
jgi:nuclear pore complex protein Nup133